MKDGEAVALRGDPAPPLHARIAVQQGRGLPGLRALARPPAVSDAPRRTEGQRRVRPHLVGRGARDGSRRGSRDVIATHGAEAIWPFLGTRQHGADPGRLRRGTPALERARRVASRADDLHDRGRIRHRLHAGRQPRRNGSGDVPVLEARRALGRERAVDASAPVAADPRGAEERRVGRRHRSDSDADRRGERLAPRADARHRRRARARPAARRAGRRQGGSGVHRRAHRRLGGVSPAHPRVSAVARRRDHRALRRVHRRAGQAAGRDSADRHPHRHRHSASRRRRHGGADDHVHSRRHRRLALSGRRRPLRHARLLRPELGRAVARRPQAAARRARCT